MLTPEQNEVSLRRGRLSKSEKRARRGLGKEGAPAGSVGHDYSDHDADSDAGAVDHTLHLPEELMIAIFMLCPLEQLFNRTCSLVCRRWARLVKARVVQRRMRTCRWEGYTEGWLRPSFVGTVVGESPGEITVGPDGKVYCVDDRRVVALDAAKHKQLWSFKHLGDAFAVRVSPKNVVYTTSFDRTVKVWSGETGKLLHTLRGHKRAIFSVVTDPATNRTYTGDFDGVIRVWSNGRHVQTFHTETDKYARSMAIANGRLYCGSDSGIIRVWNCVDGTLFATLTGHADVVSAMTVARDNTVYSASYDGTVRAWSGTDGTFVKLVFQGRVTIEDIACDGHGQLYVTGGEFDSSNESLRIFSSRRTGNRHLHTIQNVKTQMVACSPNGRVFTLSPRSPVLMW